MQTSKILGVLGTCLIFRKKTLKCLNSLQKVSRKPGVVKNVFTELQIIIIPFDNSKSD